MTLESRYLSLKHDKENNQLPPYRFKELERLEQDLAQLKREELEERHAESKAEREFAFEKASEKLKEQLEKRAINLSALDGLVEKDAIKRSKKKVRRAEKQIAKWQEKKEEAKKELDDFLEKIHSLSK